MKKIVSVLAETASGIERGIDFFEAIEEINDSKNILIISVSCNFASDSPRNELNADRVGRIIRLVTNDFIGEDTSSDAQPY